MVQIPVLVTPPAVSPVTLDEAKRHCRVLHDDDNSYIEALIAAATNHFDGWDGVLGRCIVEQTWRQDFCRLDCLRLAIGPVLSISAVTFYDSNNVSQTLDESSYELRRDYLGNYVALASGQSWPTSYRRDDSVSVSFVAGQPVEKVPASLKAAILLLIGHLYENREAAGPSDIAELPFSVSTLISKFRKMVV
jgi:uncharacterized phiE125 gp8 family phage protein